MTAEDIADLTPEERVRNLDLILEQMQLAVREALLRHKQAGNPVCEWRNGRVEWIRPEDIPVDDAPKNGP